ncbi:MAG: response regulator [Rhizobiaceae bacterium]
MTEALDSQTIRVAIVEDDPFVLERLESALKDEEDIRIVGIARNAVSGLEMIKNGGFDVLLCDLGLPDGSGVQIIREASRRKDEVDSIVITIFADQAKVIDSIKAGARGYLLKDEQFANCAESIREIRRGGSPISPVIARQLLRLFQPERKVGNQVRNAENLTPRELEVLNLLSRGFSMNEIANILLLARPTISTFVKGIYRKLEVNSKSEAVYEATNLGLINLK